MLGPRPHPLETALGRPSPCQPGGCAPAAPVPLVDDGRGKWRRCLISPMLPRPPWSPPRPRPRAPRASGLLAPEAGPRERPRGGGGGGAGRGRGATGRGPGCPRDNALAARAGARAGPAPPQGLSGVLIPALRRGGTRSEEGRRCGVGGDWRCGSERLLCWGAVSSSREENGAWCKSLLSHAVSSAFCRLPRPLRPTCLPPPEALSAPGFWRLPGVARPPSSVLVLIPLVLYRIRVPFSPSLFSPLVF